MKSNESTLSQVKLFKIRSAQKMSWKWKIDHLENMRQELSFEKT